MPMYRLVLTWTPYGADPHNPHSVSERRDAAVLVAQNNNVTGPNGQPIKPHITPGPHGATWIVEGADTDVDNMIDIWKGFKNVTVEKHPLGPKAGE
jgi:hypothetical protein